MVEMAVDQIARDAARDAAHAIENIRAVTDVRLEAIDMHLASTHKEINEKIDRIESAIKWAGGLIISLMITVLGWSVLQQLNANDSQRQGMQQQIQLLQQQEQARVRNSLAAGAAESADPSRGGR